MTVRGANYPRKANDFYATPPETTRVLLDHVRFSNWVCDPARGEDAIVKVLVKYGYNTCGGDLSKGYDFLIDKFKWTDCDIVTNPPFGGGGRQAVQFIERALHVTKSWNGAVAMLLPVDFDSGRTRAHVFADCPQFATKIVLLNRIRWFNGQSGSVNHGWFIWRHGHTGAPELKYALQQYQPVKPGTHHGEPSSNR